MNVLLVFLLIASAVIFIVFEQISMKAKELLNDDDCIIEQDDGKLVLKIRRHSVKGWIARYLEIVRYLEVREETSPFAEPLDSEYVENQGVRIQIFLFKFTHAGETARNSNCFGFKLFARTVFFLLKKLIWILLTISGLLLWLHDRGYFSIS